MKIIAISRDKEWFRIGESQQSSQWYGVTKVQEHIGGLQKGDVIEIKSSKDSNGKNQISYIKKIAGGAPAGSPQSGQKSYAYAKSPQETEIIRRQAIGHMVSRTLSGVQLAPPEMEAQIRSLYALYQELVNPAESNE